MASIKMKINQLKDDIIEVKILVMHPMENGDKPHYIKECTLTANDKVIMTGKWSTAISKNPFLGCRYKGAAGDKIQFSWLDNKGETDKAEITVPKNKK